MTWSSESLRRASPDVLRHHDLVDRFLKEAAQLTSADWCVIYARYLGDQHRIDRSVPGFDGASIDSIVRRQRAETKEESTAAMELVGQANAWVKAIASGTEGEAAPKVGTVSFQERIGWIIQRVVVILWSLDRVVAVPKRLAAAQRFLTLFGGFIEFPEVQ